MKLSPYLMTIITSWVFAQGAKYLIIAVKNRNFSGFRQLYLSGNMPSAHSATVVSMATVIGLINGFDSALFGLAGKRNKSRVTGSFSIKNDIL
jgi:acid phosphatase family membrane protein YuiD